MPKVSVIIPTYNHGRYICEAVDSVLTQTFRDFEIIVVDDYSQDNTGEVLLKYAVGIKYIAHQQNKGSVAAKNTGIALAQGEYIAILDADDIWHPENLALKVNFLERNEQIVAVCSDFEVFGAAVSKSSFAERRLFKTRKTGEEFIIEETFGLLLKGCFMFSSTVLLRKIAFEQFGNFKIEGADDFDLFLGLSKNANFGCINQPLVKKRDHKNNISKKLDANYYSRILALNNALEDPSVRKRCGRKVLKRISETYFSWSYRLFEENRFKESREKALASVKYGPNFGSLKIILKSLFPKKN